MSAYSIYLSPFCGIIESKPDNSIISKSNMNNSSKSFEELFPKKESLKIIKDTIDDYLFEMSQKKGDWRWFTKFDFEIRRSAFPDVAWEYKDKLNFYIYDYLLFNKDFSFHFKSEELKRKFFKNKDVGLLPYDTIYVTHKDFTHSDIADENNDFKIYIDRESFYEYTKRKEYYFNLKKDY